MSRTRALILRVAILLAATLGTAWSGTWSGTRSSAPAGASEAALKSPGAVLKTFDTLLETGHAEEARRLCTGQMLRMFDFIAMTQSKMGNLIDSTRSSDSTLEEKIASTGNPGASAAPGVWAYVKISSHVVFRQAFMGQKEMNAVEAVHFYRAPQGWLIAEMEELENEATAVHFRSGVPESAVGASPQGAATSSTPSSSDGASAATSKNKPNAGLFPVSVMAPTEPVQADSMRYRLRLKNGGRLADVCPLGPEQARLREISPSEWILQNRKSSLASPPPRSAAAKDPAHAAERGAPDSLARFLASDTYLDLSDTLLKQTAARIAGSETRPAKLAGLFYRYVVDHFHFELGAVIFGTSREVLRGMTGDCSEAAILTAALLRARGVPSRVALGYASLGQGVFIGHAWTEAWMGQWVGVDAALGQYPAGVERIKLAELDGKADMRIAATNLMLSVLSNLDMEILDVWKDGRKVPLKNFGDKSGEAAKFFDQILKNIDEGITP